MGDWTPDDAPSTGAGWTTVRAALDVALATLAAQRGSSPDDGPPPQDDDDPGFAPQADTDPDTGPDTTDDTTADKKTAKKTKTPTAVKRAQLDHTDLGFAMRLEFYAKGRLVFSNGLGGWAAFDGQRFDANDGEALAHREVLAVRSKIKSKEYPDLREFWEKALTIPKHPDRVVAESQVSALWKAAIGLGNVRKQASVLKQAAVLPEFLTPFDALDAQGGHVNTPGGVLELPLARPRSEVGITPTEEMFAVLQDLALRPARPADRMTRVCGAAPQLDVLRADDEDPCPNWTAHIKAVFPGDTDKQSLFQRMCGSMLVAHNPKNKWFILQGKGGDGKSVTMRAIQNVLGDYFRTGAIESLLYDPRRSAGGTREDLMRMVGGTRVVMFPEPSRKDILDDGFIKKASGGEEISARSGYGKQDEYRPDFKMVLMCNPLPKVQGNDDGFWRRPILIRFPRQFAAADQDADIDRKLAAEGPGIFNWLVEGFLDWRARGFDFDEPQDVKDDLNTYRRQSSPLEAWAQDRLIQQGWLNRDKIEFEKPGFLAGLRNTTRNPDDVQADIEWLRDPVNGFITDDPAVFAPPGYSPKADIYADFCSWCADDGMEPWRPNGFAHAWAQHARAMGCWDTRHGVRGRWWHGFDFVTGAPNISQNDDDNFGGF